MRPLRSLSLALALASTSPLAAQYVQPLPQRGDADALADQIRALAANPLDLNALVQAGELTLKLDDPTAAAGFFARAERIDPRNARVKAGLGKLLVQAERPGEALRRFAEAESYGGRVASFAADRGLAFDLIGEQERAQRDYRLALKAGPDDETTRRYALSLGISGQREEALTLLDPLLRKSDRGAWRARAFILAMSGDRTNAEQIATTMMPAGLSQGLQPFFDRLPTLSPVDRAFAVHFGEIRPSAQRFADARMVPTLPPLGADPDARELAAAAKTHEKPLRGEEAAKPAKRKRGRREPVELAVQAAAPAPLPLPAPPAYANPSAAARTSATSAPNAYYVQQLPVSRAPAPSYNPVAQANRAVVAPSAMPQVSPATQPIRPVPATIAPVAVAQTQVAPAHQPVPRVTGRVMPLAPLQPAPLPQAQAYAYTPARPPASVFTPPAETNTTVSRGPAAAATAAVPTQAFPAAAPVPRAAQVAPVTVPSVPQPAPGVAVARTAPPQPASVAVVPSRPIPAQVASTPLPASTVAVPTATAQAAPVNAVKAQSEDAILSGIIAKIGVPGAELGVTPVEPEVRPAPATVIISAPQPARVEVVAAKVPARVEEPRGRTQSTDTELNAGAKKLPDPKKLRAAVKKTEADDVPDSGKAVSARKRAGKNAADVADAVDRRKPSDSKTHSDKTGGDTDDARDIGKGTDSRKHGNRKGVDQDDELEAADSKKSGDRKGDSKKSADARKLAEAKKKDPKVLEPARVWVQVSGGANEHDLTKQWNKLRADKPGAFKSRQGWSTPLRATNRILTGPFASESEAQAYVNKLAKQGVSGFVFTSDAGQKIEKLPVK